MIDIENRKLPYLFPAPPRSACEVGSGVDRYLLTLDSALNTAFPRIESALDSDSVGNVAVVSESFESASATDRSNRSIASYLPKSLKLLIGYTRETLELRREFRRGEFRTHSFIHVNRVGCEVQTIAAKLAGYRRVVTTVHNLPGEDSAALHWLRRLIERVSFACGDRHICVSQATFDAWHERVGLKREAADIVYNGLFAPDYSGFDRAAYRRNLLPVFEGAVWIGICARLHPMKGHAVLLQAFAQLLEKVPQLEVVLVIAGSGSLDCELRQLSKDLGIEAQVYFLGHRTDATEFASAIDLNVLPSVHSETLGYSLIEAMFAGRPSVVSDVGGMKELMSASAGGQIVPAGDVGALAQAFADYVQQPELMQADGVRAQQYALAHLTADKMATATLEVYSKL